MWPRWQTVVLLPSVLQQFLHICTQVCSFLKGCSVLNTILFSYIYPRFFFFFLFNFKSSFSCSLLTCWLNSKASPLTNFFWAHVLGGNHGVGRRQWMWLLLTIHSVCTLDQWAGIMLSSDFSKCSVVNRTELSKIKHVEQSLPSQCFPIFCLLEKDRGGRRKGEKRETL